MTSQQGLFCAIMLTCCLNLSCAALWRSFVVFVQGFRVADFLKAIEDLVEREKEREQQKQEQK
jgi:hypothetical protein